MQHKHNNKLITNVLIIGGVIAILSYLFHPGVGQFSVMLNGEPVADPLVRFAAIPTLLIIMAVTGLLNNIAVYRCRRVYVSGRHICCISNHRHYGALFLAGAGYNFSDNRLDDF